MRRRPAEAATGEHDEEAGILPDDEKQRKSGGPPPRSYAPQSWLSTDSLDTSALLTLGLLTRFVCLLWPPQVVFDEVHFGKFVSGYISGHYFFDIHPPLGKLMIALVAGASGYDATQPFATIGEPYHAHVNLFALRALPATMGALLVPLAYLTVRAMGASRCAALVAAGIVLCDGAALVESRLLLTDAPLFFFELLQLYGMVLVAQAPSGGAAFHCRLALTGSAIGCAISIKWTALATMAVVGLDTVRALLVELQAVLCVARVVDHPHGSPASMRALLHSFVARFFWLLVLPFSIYLLSFVAHLRLLPYSGPGDGFHDLSFTCRLMLPPSATAAIGRMGPRWHWWETRSCNVAGCDHCEGVHLLSVLDAIVALNKRMLSANASIKRGHAFGSGWQMWPLSTRVPAALLHMHDSTHHAPRRALCAASAALLRVTRTSVRERAQIRSQSTIGSVTSTPHRARCGVVYSWRATLSCGACACWGSCSLRCPCCCSCFAPSSCLCDATGGGRSRC